jgi:hypothetical protein
MIFVVFHLLDHVLIDGVYEIKNFVTLLLKRLNEWRLGNSLSRLTSDVVNVFLAFLHAGNVLLERDLVLTTLGSVETKKISELFAVCSIFVDTKLEVLGKLLVEFFVVLLVLGDFSEHF